MRIATNKNTFTNAIITKIGNCYLVTIGAVRKIYDNEQTAHNYIVNLGYTF